MHCIYCAMSLSTLLPSRTQRTLNPKQNPKLKSHCCHPHTSSLVATTCSFEPVLFIQLIAVHASFLPCGFSLSKGMENKHWREVAIWKVVALLCLTLIVRGLKVGVEQRRVVKTLIIIKHYIFFLVYLLGVRKKDRNANSW